jgi:phage head maturation protease
MKDFVIKKIESKALDIDTGTKQVKVVLSSMGNVDRDNDVIAPGAFTKTLTERGPDGTNEIWHLIDHRASLQTALGKFKELYVEGDPAYRGKYL